MQLLITKKSMTNLKINPNDLKTPPERLIYLRKMCSISRADFSQLSEISYNSLKKWEYVNKNSFKRNTAEKIVKTFKLLGVNCTTNWFMNGGGEPPSCIHDDSTLKNTEELTDLDNNDINIMKEISLFKSINKDSELLILTDNSMNPFYKAGDIVGGIKKSLEDIYNVAMNKICIVGTKDGIKILRKLTEGTKINCFTLVALNNENDYFPPLKDVPLIYAAPIIWHRSKEE